MIVIDGTFATTLDVRDRGLAYGHGVFETMRLWDGELPLWAYHRERLIRGLNVLGIPLRSEVISASLELLQSRCASNGIVKLVITAGVGGRGYGWQDELTPTVIAQWLPVGPPRADTLKLAVSEYRLPTNPLLAGIKHLNRLDQVLASRTVASGYQPLLLDHDDRVIEGLSHNIFVYHHNRWLTPQLDNCGVAGTVRAVLIREVFPTLQMPLEIVPFGVEMLRSAQEVFLCNAVAGVMPVNEIVGLGVYSNHAATSVISDQLARIYPCYTA